MCRGTLRTGRKAARRRLTTMATTGGRLDAGGSTLRHAAADVLVAGFIGHVVTPSHVEVMVESLRRRRSLLDVALSKHSLAGHDMQPMHARSPKSSDAHHACLLHRWSRDHPPLFPNVLLINFSTAFAAA